MPGFVIASTVFKRNLILYSFVVLGLLPLLMLTLNLWTVNTEQTLMSFMRITLLPAIVLAFPIAAGHLVFQAYVTAREFLKRQAEFESYDAFCEARWTEMGRPSGFVSFPVRFWPGLFGVIVFMLSLNFVLSRFFE